MSCPVTPLLTEDNRIILRQAGYSPDEVLEAAEKYQDAKLRADADWENHRLDAHEKSSAARDEAGRDLEAVTAPVMTWQDALALSDALAVAAAQLRRQQLQSVGVEAPWFQQPQQPTRDLGLTNREEEILLLLAEGVSRKDIAARLYVSPNTIRTHVQAILRKTGTNSAIAAVAEARRAGLLGGVA